ncbi:long-chain-fatty-acid--CoA ligase ACSBG2-like [Ochotona princeps]|uniref:long-chain-fatty-acid--CoA ligase ACSBG2-like n=1 Tax=Ochotona princeps TaxID=9978 RepID=UPI0027155693|nr:long-chain-fatty-acid--CoA ligase ACSBG2-like [Ochotona princeps]
MTIESSGSRQTGAATGGGSSCQSCSGLVSDLLQYHQEQSSGGGEGQAPVTLEEEPEDHWMDTSKPPRFFRDSVNHFGTHPALASKNGKKWEMLNFTQYYQACRKAARSLIKLGLQHFHAVGILGFNSMQWFIATLGAILAGGLCVGIYATNSADACQYVISQAKVNLLLVENDQQLQKILSVKPDLARPATSHPQGNSRLPG